MDMATPVGVIVALVAIFGSMIMEGSNPGAVLQPTPLILVFLGTFGVALAGVLVKDVKGIPKVIKAGVLAAPPSPGQAIARIVEFAQTARKEGLLALDGAAQETEDPFLRMGLEHVIDGTDPDQLRALMEAEITAMQSRHRMGAKFFQDMGGYAPTLGILGTVVGLIHVLGNLSTPKTLGPLIAEAFTATLWGVLSANVFWLPIANKLKRASDLEVRAKRLMLDGILAIQSGSSPRLVEEKLRAQLPPSERQPIEEAAA